MKQDGVAALLDALIFLAVVAVVSTALLAAASPRALPPPAEASSELDAVHEALLRCTVPASPGKALPLLEAVVQGSEVSPPAKDVIERILGELLPTMDWRWAVSMPSGADAIGRSIPAGVDIFASVVRVPAPGGEVVFTLQAWAR